MEIKIKPIFGTKSKNKLTCNDGYIKLHFTDAYMTTRTYYEYNGPKDGSDDESVCVDSIVNEQTYIKKSSIIKIGCAYDAKEDAFYVSIDTIGDGGYWFNVETAEEANDILYKLKKWWLQ